MNMTTKVSVIVCTFNRCGSLADTLASLAALKTNRHLTRW